MWVNIFEAARKLSLKPTLSAEALIGTHLVENLDKQ